MEEGFILLIHLFQSIKKHFRYNFLLYFILSIIFIMGNIIGPLMVRIVKYDTQIRILKSTHPYFKHVYLGAYSNLSILRSSLFNNVIMVVVLGTLGFINIGIILIPIIVFLKGVFLGFSVSLLVFKFGIRGFLTSLLGIYPQNIFIILGIIGVGSLAMTKASNQNLVFKRKTTLKQDFKTDEYIILISTFAMIITIGCLIEGLISPIILKLIIKNII